VGRHSYWAPGPGEYLWFRHFYFNHLCDPDTDSRSRGVGSSIFFETHDVLKKELRYTGRTS
jgi:hypothetical protein